MLDLSLDSLLALLVLAGSLAVVIGGALMALRRAPRAAPLPGFPAANLVAVGALLVLVGTFGPAPETAEAQESSPDGAYDEKSGLITPSTSGRGVRIVTTDTVPGQSCVALDRDGGQLPVMVLPGFGKPGIRAQLAAIRGMQTLREAAAEAAANAVLGLRTAAFVNRQGNPRMFLYGTLARCE